MTQKLHIHPVLSNLNTESCKRSHAYSLVSMIHSPFSVLCKNRLFQDSYQCKKNVFFLKTQAMLHNHSFVLLAATDKICKIPQHRASGDGNLMLF